MTDWKKKLTAFLHDPPHKPFDIRGHEYNRGPLLRHLGLTEEDIRAWERGSDWLAAAADRFPFPRSASLRVDWLEDGECEFRHPLGAGPFKPTRIPRPRSATGEAWIEKALHGIQTDEVGWKAKFMRVWRLWPERSAREHDPLMAYLVADTRIPDHTLWHHNGLVSALHTAGEKPAFLLFQIGPVQEFIAKSRSMRDLWSASYLITFLISKALATVADELGPDVVIFPNLRAVPLLDWWWSQESGLFPDEYLSLGSGRLHRNELLMPSLPNRFLALIPGGTYGRQIAASAETAVRYLWRDIANTVHRNISEAIARQGPFIGWDAHWEQQVSRFPTVDWIIHEWVSEDEALRMAADKEPSPPLSSGWQNHPLHHAALWRGKSEKSGGKMMIPGIDRESWHGNRNDAFAWPLHFAVAEWKFAACKNARAFEPWVSLAKGSAAPPKDHLNGRDEALGGASPEAFWGALRVAYGGAEQGTFKGKQLYGALSVIKRLWPKAFLQDHLGWQDWKPRFESVQDIAEAIESEREEDLEKQGPTYYAVLCMDGDDMGQWVSGVKTPLLKSALANKAWDYFARQWQTSQARGLVAEQVHRPLSPGFHAAFSEAVSNFGMYCADQIVTQFSGQLLYSGGDDVLAIVPARNALDCAYALQCAFCGQMPLGSSRTRQCLEQLFEFPSDGFVRCRNSGKDEALRPNWPLIVPGSKASASVGVAIGHVRSPMQDTIQAAREAEAVAKNIRQKGAVCVRILKRSGEGVEFAARFQSKVLQVWAELELDWHALSRRFSYCYIELLRPLLADSSSESDGGWVKAWNRSLAESVQAELQYAHFQHREAKGQNKERRDLARQQAEHWIRSLVGETSRCDDVDFEPALTPRGFIHFWMAWAFVRQLMDSSSEANKVSWKRY
jgi:CRISPR-associated protein Cmr2